MLISLAQTDWPFHWTEIFWDETIGKAGAEGLDNVDVMTDAASTVGGTEFTRYTRGAMSTANSRLSKSSKYVQSSPEAFRLAHLLT